MSVRAKEGEGRKEMGKKALHKSRKTRKVRI